MNIHVFVVNQITFKQHLEYMFAGTGAKNRMSLFLEKSDIKFQPTTERNLVGMIADISRIRPDDKIIFYLQATVNNPISEPYILGVSSGATFGATLFIVIGLGTFVSGGAFVGAVIATVMVLGIASGHGKMTTTRLILAGTVVNALFTAFSNFIISVGANADSIMTIKFWTMGSLANAGWKSIILPAVVVIAVTLFFCTQYRILNTMMLGDETAVTLGINLSLYRKVYMTLIAVVTGVLVSSCGIIGFVGLIIPHISRAFAGTNHKRLVPVVILLGAIFLIWADVLARVLVKNAELPIGIFTALVGAPFFTYIVTKKNYGRE